MTRATFRKDSYSKHCSTTTPLLHSLGISAAMKKLHILPLWVSLAGPSSMEPFAQQDQNLVINSQTKWRERERERESKRSIQGSWSFFDIISSIFLYPTARRPSCCQGLLLLLLPRRETLATRRTEEKPTTAAGINTVNNIRRNILDPSMKRAVGFHRDLFVSEPRTDRQQTDSSQEARLRPSLTACKLSFFLSPFGRVNREEETHTLHCCSCCSSCTVLLCCCCIWF